jgi:hypothetical protein
MISLSGLSAVPAGYTAGLDTQAKLAELARQQVAAQAAGRTLAALAGGGQGMPQQDGVSPLLAALRARGAQNVQPTVSPNALAAPDNSFNGRFVGAPAPQPTVPPQMQGVRPGSLSWDAVVRTIAQANPGIAPDALASVVSTLTPLMNADSQERWKALDAQIKARQLDIAAQRTPAGLGANGQKAPPGYRFTADGSRLEPIPGGPKGGDPIKARNTLDTLRRQWGVVGTDIDRALAMIGDKKAWFPRTGAGVLVSAVPGTPQHDLANLLNTIKANIGFEQLSQMRAASPTGGALGQVSDFENKLLQAVQGALEQSQTAAQLTTNLTRVKTLLADTLREKQQAYDMDFGAQGDAVPASPDGADINTNPMFGGAGDQGEPVEGDIATGPNGQQLILRNNQWVPR